MTYCDPKKSDSSEVRSASEAGCCFYSDPLLLTDEMIDPLLRVAIRRINASGWAWTAESCQGHPDDVSDSGPWAGNVRPFLRLVCRKERSGQMMAALLEAMDAQGHGTLGFECWPMSLRHQSAWTCLIVYIKASSVGERNAGVAAFERFGKIVTEDR